ncbi:cholesterol esterase [Streptomyces fuscichromogenes]|uniref:Cholesterol esterase n=2 Tax=Streptomyces fuscichromogenes TaxID=1324013 RepID=A0A917XG00_9ACTN|nr:cholesterol esterase [Streptomyces fuscichromogenes]
MIASFAASTGLFIAVAQGALAASFTISNQEMKISTERAEGAGLIEYTATDRRYDGKRIPVLVSGLRFSKSKGICQSTVFRNIPLLGTYTVKVTTKESTARDSYSDVIRTVAGATTATGHRSGVATGADTKGPGIKAGDKVDPASAARDSDSIVVTDSKQIVLATTTGSSESSGVSVRIHKGLNECF